MIGNADVLEVIEGLMTKGDEIRTSDSDGRDTDETERTKWCRD